MGEESRVQAFAFALPTLIPIFSKSSSPSAYRVRSLPAATSSIALIVVSLKDGVRSASQQVGVSGSVALLDAAFFAQARQPPVCRTWLNLPRNG